MDINQREIAYVKGEAIPFENGIEWNEPLHFYSYDLDIFGEKSLYQHLNRTATYMGKQRLAKRLLVALPNNESVTVHQKAIQDSPLISFLDSTY